MSKRIKIISLCFTLIMFFCFIFSRTPQLNAIETKNNKDFSQFVNINKPKTSEDTITYTSEITIQTINKTNDYQICNELQSIYGETVEISSDMTYKKQNNYGFKINGEFFTESVTIKENGNYLIQVCFFAVSNKIISISSKPIESFNITVDLERKLEMSKKIFYYEHYSYTNDFINDIEKSNNLSANLTYNSKTILTEAFESYLSIRKTNKDYIADKLEENVIILFENFNEEFPVILRSIRSSNIEPINWEKALENNFDLIIDTNRYYSYIGTNLKDIPILNNQIYTLNLNIPEGHLVNIDFDCKVTLPRISYSGVSSDYIISYQLTDVGTDTKYSFNRKVYFYNGNLNSDKEKPIINFIDDLTIKQNDENFNFMNLIKSTYDVIILNNVKFNSTLDVYKIYFDTSKVDFKKPGFYDVIFTCIDYSGNTTVETVEIEIVDYYAPKVLTKYNKTYINRKTKEFLNQIIIIDNFKVDTSKTKYTYVEENENGGYIIVHAEDFHGNTTDKVIHFIYEKELSTFEKIFVLPFYNIKKFIIDIFN